MKEFYVIPVAIIIFVMATSLGLGPCKEVEEPVYVEYNCHICGHPWQAREDSYRKEYMACPFLFKKDCTRQVHSSRRVVQHQRTPSQAEQMTETNYTVDRPNRGIFMSWSTADDLSQMALMLREGSESIVKHLDYDEVVGIRDDLNKYIQAVDEQEGEADEEG